MAFQFSVGRVLRLAPLVLSAGIAALPSPLSVRQALYIQ
jgi:hypothetical protein